MCRYADCCAVLHENFLAGEPIDQVQVIHDACPSIANMLSDTFNEFLQTDCAARADGPTDLEAWETRWRCRFTLTNDDDPDGIGFVPWRACFYVGGGPAAVHRFLHLFDDFCQWRTTRRPNEESWEPATLKIMHEDRCALQLKTDQFVCATTAATVTKHTRLSPLQAQPPHWTRQIVFISVEIFNDDCVSLLIGGNTFSYRDGLDALQIHGGFESVKCVEGYLRVTHAMDPMDSKDRTLVANLLGPVCLKNAIVAYRSRGKCAAMSAADAFLDYVASFPGTELVRAR